MSSSDHRHTAAQVIPIADMQPEHQKVTPSDHRHTTAQVIPIAEVTPGFIGSSGRLQNYYSDSQQRRIHRQESC